MLITARTHLACPFQSHLSDLHATLSLMQGVNTVFDKQGFLAVQICLSDMPVAIHRRTAKPRPLDHLNITVFPSANASLWGI